MSRKAFIIWGLALIHLHILTIATLQYFALSRIISIEVFKSYVPAGVLLLLGAVIISFGLVLWKKLDAKRAKKIGTLALCFLFILISFGVSGPLIMLYTETGLYSNTTGQLYKEMGAFFKNGGIGNPWDIGQTLTFVSAHIPAFYISMWGFFALLAVGSMDPNSPNSIWQKAKHLIKRAPKQTPLQADPILVNGAW